MRNYFIDFRNKIEIGLVKDGMICNRYHKTDFTPEIRYGLLNCKRITTLNYCIEFRNHRELDKAYANNVIDYDETYFVTLQWVKPGSAIIKAMPPVLFECDDSNIEGLITHEFEAP